LTGSPVRPSQFFLNQNDAVLVKKTKVNGCNQVFDRVLPGHRVNPPGQQGFSFLYFFFNPIRFQSLVGWVQGDPPDQAEFQNYKTNNSIFQNRSIPYN
jgi:hypothetical protein